MYSRESQVPNNRNNNRKVLWEDEDIKEFYLHICGSPEEKLMSSEEG